MHKPYSTKLPRPVPAEFEQAFIAGGWARVNQMYGKRPAVRYFTALGPARLRKARDDARAGLIALKLQPGRPA